MSHTHCRLLFHVVFGTKERRAALRGEMKADLLAYMGGIVRQLGGRALMIGGTEDHVHLLINLRARLALADAVRLVKSNSSRWVHQRWPGRAGFAWQAGYGAFSVSESNREALCRYIAAQQDHHRKTSFRDELVALLKRHGISYDEEHLWD